MPGNCPLALPRVPSETLSVPGPGEQAFTAAGVVSGELSGLGRALEVLA